MNIEPRIAVVIPCFRVREQIISVVEKIGEEVGWIIVVDDACPEKSGHHVGETLTDDRVIILAHTENRGVGGAVVTGYFKALELGAEVIVKLDGDGQHDPALIPKLVQSIVEGDADYTKGNRFFYIDSLMQMPKLRLIGNGMLSFLNKVVSGYWDIMDPTNGFTSIHRNALSEISLDKLDNGYFFESDMLFRLSIIRAVVKDVSFDAKYSDEKSSLSVSQVLRTFPGKYVNRFIKRIFYNYFLRDFNAGSLWIVFGTVLLGSGTTYGAIKWYSSISTGEPATAGMVMISAIQVLIGIQMLIFAMSYDIANIPRNVRHR